MKFKNPFSKKNKKKSFNERFKEGISKVLNVFLIDLEKIFKRPIAVLVLGGLLIIPGIYAWLNIDSNWNPYDNTSNLQIAVVNEDSGVNILDDEVNMGSMLVDSLSSNNAMKWTFVDYKTAKEKVDKGEYYGAIVIPSDFSSKLTTVIGEDGIEKPSFDFYVNHKKNPIAPIIVNKAVGTIENTLDQAFVNALVFKAVSKFEEHDLLYKTDASIDDVIDALNKTKTTLDDLKLTIDTVGLMSESASSALTSLNKVLPAVTNTTNKTITEIKNVNDIVGSFNEYFNDVNRNTYIIISSIQTINNNILTLVNSGASRSEIIKSINDLEETLNNLKNILDDMKGLKINISSSLSKKVDTVLSYVSNIKKIINAKEGVLSSDEISNIKRSISAISTDMSSIKTTYKNNLLPELEKVGSNITSNISNVSDTILSLNTTVGSSTSAIKNMITALDNTGKITKNLNKTIDSIKEDIDTVIDKLNSENLAKLYQKLVNLLNNAPSDVASFIATPIETNEIDIYSINSYGSKMAPFYTILAAWVGCTLLVSIVKTEVKEEKKTKGLKPYQAFFGRFLLFAIMAMLQGFIIALGDIVMHVQVINYPLFILTVMLSSLVFMLIVYSLTISFGKVGEAIAVVIMVLQVAGSGGTFPVELLPGFFQKLQIVMPFYPAMNALRETIGGFYGNSYIMYILGLLCHIIIPLLLGLVLRNPIIKIKESLTKKLESTDLIV